MFPSFQFNVKLLEPSYSIKQVVFITLKFNVTFEIKFPGNKLMLLSFKFNVSKSPKKSYIKFFTAEH